jgi:hypothetical protein
MENKLDADLLSDFFDIPSFREAAPTRNCRSIRLMSIAWDHGAVLDKKGRMWELDDGNGTVVVETNLDRIEAEMCSRWPHAFLDALEVTK